MKIAPSSCYIVSMYPILDSCKSVAYGFSHVLGKVGDIEIGGLLITLRLEAGVERLLRER